MTMNCNCERTSEEISAKIKYFELWMQENPDDENTDFIQGSLSALYWITKQKNPYTGNDFSKV